MAVVGMLVFLLMWGAKADGYEPGGIKESKVLF